MHRMPHLYGSYSVKSPTIDGSFAERDLQLKASYASSPPCTSTILHYNMYGVATISRLLKIINLFCRIESLQ